MNRSRYVVLLLAVAIGAAANGILHAQKETEQSEGNTPYTPTKLEWLALLSNVEQGNDGEIHISFRPHPEKANTIQAQVFHSPGDDESLVKGHMKIAERTVTQLSEQYGWEWAEVEVQPVELITALSD